MAVFNAAKREIDIKIVYYGPALCGKTTNVQCIHKLLAPQQRGEIMSLATKDDRTLFFDFLPIELGDVKGFKTRFHVYTVPGQVYYALTRRAVLTGVDGVIFVADSQSDKMEENIESIKDLEENLKYYKKSLETVPFVMQYNKRDLPNVLSVEELNTTLNTRGVPFFSSSAVEGTGVMETLTSCCKLVLKQMDSSSDKKRKRHGVQDTSSAGDETEAGPEITIAADTDTGLPAGDVPVSGTDNVSLDALKLEESPVSESAEPDIRIDTSAGGMGVDSAAEPIDLDAVAAESTAEGTSEGMLFEPEGIGIADTGEGISIESCGETVKISERAVKVPLVLRSGPDKTYSVTITITLDDITGS